MGDREEFSKYRINVPKLILSAHNSRDDTHIDSWAPYQMSMGLGFTDRTTRALKICHPWMRISRKTAAGETVSLHEKLVLRTNPGLNREPDDFTSPVGDEAPFWRRLPRGWEQKTYLTDWSAWYDIDNTTDNVWDYAIIFRHTQIKRGHRQVLFVLAGFTERGTAVAGEYLAAHWDTLCDRYVSGKPHYGDFMTLIEGPSDPDKVSDWLEDTSFTVTPQIVYDCGITECEWYDRVKLAKA